jgi:hypothetical protein
MAIWVFVAFFADIMGRYGYQGRVMLMCILPVIGYPSYSNTVANGGLETVSAASRLQLQ